MEVIQNLKETKANKEHRCNFCNEKIAIGETYFNSVLKENGVYEWKSHLHCEKIADRLKMYDDMDGEGVTSDMFQETISDSHFEILIATIPENEIQKYSDIIQQLRNVRFKEKLLFVIKYYNKLETTPKVK